VKFTTQPEEGKQQGGCLESRVTGNDSQKTPASQLSSSPDIHPAPRRHPWLAHGGNWRWGCLIIAVLVSLKSFFVRQLLSALLLFAVVFVIAAALIALFILIDDAADSAVSRAASGVRSIHFPMPHFVALPARVSTGGARCAVRRSKKIDHS
jgi:hypothetical protein